MAEIRRREGRRKERAKVLERELQGEMVLQTKVT